MNSPKTLLIGFMLSMLAVSAAMGISFDSVLVAHGRMPQWSPSGKMISVLRSDSIVIFDSKTLEIRGQLYLRPWQDYRWYDEENLAVGSESRTEADKPCDRWRISKKGILNLNGEIRVISQDTSSAYNPHVSPWVSLPSGQVGCYLMQGSKHLKFLQPGEHGWKEVEPDTIQSREARETFAVERRTMEVVPSPSYEFAYAYSDNANFAAIIGVTGNTIFPMGARVTVLPNDRLKFIADPTWSASSRYFAWVEQVEDGHFSYGAEVKVLDFFDKKVTVVASDPTDALHEVIWSPTADEFLLVGHSDASIWKWSTSVSDDPNAMLFCIGSGAVPQWSLDDRYISFVRNDSLLFVDTSAVDQTKLLCTGMINRYFWIGLEDVAVEIPEKQNKGESSVLVSRILRCNVDGRTELISYDSIATISQERLRQNRLERFPDGSVGYYFTDGASENERMFTRADAAVAPDPGFYVRSAPYSNGPKLQYKLTQSGWECLYPRLAPSGDKFCCTNNSGNLIVYDTSGVELADLGQVEWSSWSKDGQWILYDIMNWGHYDLIGSDLGVTLFDGSKHRRLTFSREGDGKGAFSQDSKKVLFREGKTGEVFVLRLEKQ